jgi:rhamnosyl/mannosyltransferase
MSSTGEMRFSYKHNDETASRYGENSRRRFEEMFTADHMIDAYVNLYTTLLESKS